MKAGCQHTGIRTTVPIPTAYELGRRNPTARQCKRRGCEESVGTDNRAYCSARCQGIDRNPRNRKPVEVERVPAGEVDGVPVYRVGPSAGYLE